MEPACESSVFMLEQIRTRLSIELQTADGALATAATR